MKLIYIALNWISNPDHWVPLISAMIILLIGLFLIKKREQKCTVETEVQAQEPDPETAFEAYIRDMHKRIKNAKFGKELDAIYVEVAQRLRMEQTVNIYHDPNVPLELHKVMLRELVHRLVADGWKIKMTDDELVKMAEWENPVLVLYYDLRVFMYHQDQSEYRCNTRSLTINTNSVDELHEGVLGAFKTRESSLEEALSALG